MVRTTEKRTEKISVLVTPSARSALDGACLDYDSPQGKLINRMILSFCQAKEDKPKAKRSKQKVYPSNLEEQFELLWDIKGKRGAKNGTKGAFNIFKKLAEGASEEGCVTFTKMLMDDILKHQHEPGYPEMHLTSYLNQSRWDR